MDQNTIIRAVGIDKSFPGVHALDHLDFSLKQGSVHALLGENGAGKSTFIKLLGGFYHFDAGQLYVDGKQVQFKNPRESIHAGIGIVHQELNLAENMTVAENLFLGRMPAHGATVLDKSRMRKQANQLIQEMGLVLDPDQKVGNLSIAHQQLVEIVRVLSLDAKVVIMDEPTSSLSLLETQNLFRLVRQLAAKGISIIYVSHKLEEIFEICTDITVLRDGKLVKSLRVEQTNKQELIQLMVGRQTSNQRLERKPAGEKRVLECENLLNHKLRDVSFELCEGEIFGLSGLVGAGKTEVAKAVFGLDSLYKGEVRYLSENITHSKTSKLTRRGVGYLPEDRKHDGLFLEQDIRRNMTISSLKNYLKTCVIQPSAETKAVRKQLDLLKTKAYGQQQLAKNLSGGNQQKIILSRWLLLKNLRLLVIDEPTRGIDVSAKYEIYNILNQLASSGVAILVMSSEIAELQILCDRIGVMKSGQLTCILSGEDCTQENIMRYSVD